MKTLLIGVNGQLGSELKRQLLGGQTALGAASGVYFEEAPVCATSAQLDITNAKAVSQFVEQYRPVLILNCAAYTNVDGCETHADEAYRVNALGARNLAIAAQAVGAKLVHLSTDYVFSGEESAPRCEYDLPAPISVYGKTKLAGERFVQQYCSRVFIVRTAWLYGHNGRNFVKSILRSAREKGALTVVNDQFGNPTNASDLAWHILRLALCEEYGLYHCTGGGICSWYEFAQKIVEFAGIDAKLSPCTSEEYPSPTKRPHFSALDHMMLRLSVGDRMRPWQEALKEFLHEEQKQEE